MKLRSVEGCEDLVQIMIESRECHDAYFGEYPWYDKDAPVYLLFDSEGERISTLLPVTDYLIAGDYIELFSDYTEAYYGRAFAEGGECFMVIRKEEVDLILYSPAIYYEND